MNYNNIITGLRVQTQIPLDYKGFVQSEAALVNLGVADNLAYTYYKGLIFYCKNEGTRYEWKEVPTGQENTGLRETDFIYPADFIVDGVTYSNKRYNFFTTVVATSTLNEVLSAGNTSSNSIVLTGFVEGQPSTATFSGTGIVLATPSNETSLTITDSQLNVVGPGASTTIKFQTPSGSNLEFYTPNKPTGSYTLATTQDYNLQAVLDNGTYAIKGTDNIAVILEPLGAGPEVMSMFKSTLSTNASTYAWIGVEPETSFLQGVISGKYGSFTVDKGEPKIYRIDTVNNFTTTVSFAAPLSLSNLVFPARAAAGTYTLSILDDIPFDKTGTGIFFRGRTTANYGTPGGRSFDVSYASSPSAGVPYGATGAYSFAIGSRVSSSGFNAASFGYLIDNGGIGSFNSGYNMYDRGYTNFLTGVGHNVTSMNATVIGQAANIINEGTTDWNAYPTKALFTIGNGTIQNADNFYTVLSRSDAFKVRFNGSVEAPSLTTALITADVTGKILITKEYLTSALPVNSIQSTVAYVNSFTNDNQYPVSTGLSGKTIVSVTAFFECVTTNNGFTVGDIIDTPRAEINDTGGRGPQGVGVQFKQSTSSIVYVITGPELNIMPAYTGVASGDAFQMVDYTEWKIRLVILYI